MTVGTDQPRGAPLRVSSGTPRPAPVRTPVTVARSPQHADEVAWKMSERAAFTRRPALVSPPPPAPVVISQGTTAGSLIALTFDCGADRGYAATILGALERLGVRASFGVTGRWAYANPDLVRRMAADGDQVMNHTYDHQSFSGLSTHTPPMSSAQVAEELDDTDALLRHLTGSSTKPYFRVPYGDESRQATKTALAEGFGVDVRWSLDSLGWEGLSAASITARVLAGATPGGIMLMHVGARSQDAVALPAVIDGLRTRGYHFVTIAALLAANKAPAAPHPTAALSYRAVDPAAVYYPGPDPAALPSPAQPLLGDVVVLDPGHGGDDPGTCYPYTGLCFPSLDSSAPAVLTEKEVTLDIAVYRLLPRLHLLGADVYLTRATAEQNPDLAQRRALSSYVGDIWGVRKSGLFVSIHLNGSTDPSADYIQSLYRDGYSDRLASVLAGTLDSRAQPGAQTIDNHGATPFEGAVLGGNPLPATIVEPAFLTNAYSVVTPISTTAIVTATSGQALREGLRLTDPIVAVTIAPKHNPGRVSVHLHERFGGRVDLRRAITAARGTAVKEMLSIPGGGVFTVVAPQTTTITPAVTLPLTVSTGAPATTTVRTETPLTTTTTTTVDTETPPTMTVAISVSGAVSTTTTITVNEGEGPVLMDAHAATLSANPSYDAAYPSVFPLRYAWTDREESITRGLLAGIVFFFGAAEPTFNKTNGPAAVDGLTSPEHLTSVVPAPLSP